MSYRIEVREEKKRLAHRPGDYGLLLMSTATVLVCIDGKESTVNIFRTLDNGHLTALNNRIYAPLIHLSILESKLGKNDPTMAGSEWSL